MSSEWGLLEAQRPAAQPQGQEAPPAPRLMFRDGTERPRHLPKDAQQWGGGITWGERGAAEPATEVLGCSGEVGEAVHGGGWRAWCWGHQHRQMWHLRQVDDACKRGGGAGDCSHWGGEEPGCLLAGPHHPLEHRTTRWSTAHPLRSSTATCSLLEAHPRSECRLLTAPPPFAPKP